MMLFFKKKSAETFSGKGFVPTDRVKELQSKGFTEMEIIDMLRKEGHSADEIDKGLMSALKTGITGETNMPPMPPSQQQEKTDSSLPSPPFSDLLPQMLSQVMQQPPQQQPFQMPPQSQPPLPPLQNPPLIAPPGEVPAVPEKSLPQEYYYPESYTTEEYIDYTVKEKMTDLDQKISEFMLRYKELETKIDSLHDRLSDATGTKVTDQQLLSTKIDSFKEVVTDVDMRLSSLEKAFKETLPALIESVRSLTDLVQRMKREA